MPTPYPAHCLRDRKGTSEVAEPHKNPKQQGKKLLAVPMVPERLLKSESTLNCVAAIILAIAIALASGAPRPMGTTGSGPREPRPAVGLPRNRSPYPELSL